MVAQNDKLDLPPNDWNAVPLHPERFLEGLRIALVGAGDSAPPGLPSDLVQELRPYRERNAGFRHELLKIVCPATVNPGHELHLRLAHLHRILGFSDEATDICAAVWGDAMENFDSASREADLSFLVEGLPFDFFIRLREIPEILSRIELSAAFAIPWFQALRARIGNDLAQGGFWAGLTAWSKKCPDEALIGIGALLNSAANEDHVAITAQLLSALRQATTPAKLVREVKKLESQLKRDPDVTKRVVYHRSWIDTALDVGLDDASFEACLEQMGSGTAQEITEFFRLLYCVLHTDKITNASREKGVQWLKENTSEALGDIERHFVIGAVNRCWAAPMLDQAPEAELRALTIQAQPISITALGTWMELDQIFASSLKSDIQDFIEFFSQILDGNPVGLREVLSNDRALYQTKHALQLMGGSSVFARLLVSPDLGRRATALALYNEIPFSAFPEGFLDSRTDDEIALMILQTQVSILRPNLRLGLLLSLLERVEKSSEGLINLYQDELSHQAKNLPGLVLGGLKEIGDSSPLIKEAIGTAEAYFDGLRKASGSEIGVMRVPGLDRGRKLSVKRQSKLIAEQVEEGSVFLKHIKKSYLIYGSKGFCSFSEDRLGEPTLFQRMSTSTEMPNLDLMASEEHELRRRHALLVMRQVENLISKNQASDEF